MPRGKLQVLLRSRGLIVLNATLMTVVPSFLQPEAVAMRVANALLARDEWVKERLAAFSGRTVRIVVGPFSVQAAISSVGELVPTATEVVPDVTLTLPSDKLSLLPEVLRQGAPSAIPELMNVQGEAALATVSADVAQSLRPDPEAELARFVGDIAAVRLVSTAKQVLQASKRCTVHVSENLSEYLSEESDLLVSRGRYSLWEERLQALTTAVHRVENRMAELQQTVHSSAKGR